MKIPTELIPRCPKYGRPMTMDLRCGNTSVQDEGWYHAAKRYQDFLRRHQSGRVPYLELGVGANVPAIIKYPFWKYTAANSKATYVCVNYAQAFAPAEIKDQSICIDCDIGIVLKGLWDLKPTVL